VIVILLLTPFPGSWGQRKDHHHQLRLGIEIVHVSNSKSIQWTNALDQDFLELSKSPIQEAMAPCPPQDTMTSVSQNPGHKTCLDIFRFEKFSYTIYIKFFLQCIINTYTMQTTIYHFVSGCV
jgi:hypothetical protein